MLENQIDFEIFERHELYTKEVSRVGLERNITFTCPVVVDILQICGHTRSTQCWKQYSKSYCEEIVSFVYPVCGDMNKIKCWETNERRVAKGEAKNNEGVNYLTDDKCQMEYRLPLCQFRLNTFFICGHSRIVICGGETDTAACNAKCKSIQLCNHECLHPCKECQKCFTHIKCEMFCTKNLICRHQCSSLDCMKYSPCSEQCSFACEHLPCVKSCFETCEPYQ